MDRIVTLCSKCEALMKEAYRIRPAANATTELKKKCENCGQKGSALTLHRYLISGKRK